MCVLIWTTFVSALLANPTHESHLEPHHHRVSVQAGRAHWNACPALAAGLGEASDLRRDVVTKCLTVQRLDWEALWKRRAGHEALVTAYTGRQFLYDLRT
jgi:hypothetical protein